MLQASTECPPSKSDLENNLIQQLSVSEHEKDPLNSTAKADTGTQHCFTRLRLGGCPCVTAGGCDPGRQEALDAGWWWWRLENDNFCPW